MFLASENIDFTGLSHVFLLGGGERTPFSVGRNGEESVEKKCTSNLDTGLIRGIILMIIPLSSPLDFVLVARNQIRITGAFFLTDSSTISNYRKRSPLCLCAGKLLVS